MKDRNTSLIIIQAERNQAERRLEEQIVSIKRTIDNLETKLKSKQDIYISDGLQGNGVNIDIYLTQLITCNRAIELFKKE